jgi:hypothetical protein
MSLGFPFIVDRTQYFDWDVNVLLGGHGAVTCGRANQEARGYVPGVVMFYLAGTGDPLAVPTIHQRSATAQVSVMFRPYSYGILKD